MRDRPSRGRLRAMSIDDEYDLEALRAAGRVVRATLDAMRDAVGPGISTARLDAIAGAPLPAVGHAADDDRRAALREFLGV